VVALNIQTAMDTLPGKSAKAAVGMALHDDQAHQDESSSGAQADLYGV